ncbi:MAG: hypoxanthine phosphoribosyltransferase [Bacteroidales bacterium]|nr:hypoxanthine phosphoribosyltransferase [Bacteroidales bacterium]
MNNNDFRALQTIQVGDKKFKLYLSKAEIHQIVSQLAKRISNDLRDENPLFLAVLNGSFIFVADLMRELDFDAEISFVKMSSYLGTKSTGNVEQLIGINESIENRTIVVLEDIIDTGISMEAMLQQLKTYNPKSIHLCTLLFKPGKFVKNYHIRYIGKEIDDDFIVGYGLDYDGKGRKYSQIYTICQ